MTHFLLRQLEARLYKTIPITSTEIVPDGQPHAGQYVHRSDDGEAFMWGPTPTRYAFHKCASVAEADQIMFLCPACFEKNGGSKGTHSVMASFADRAIPDEAGSRDADGKPTRWTIVSGNGLDDLVLTPSILLDAKRPADQGCHWHGFVGSSGIPPGHAG